MGHQKRASLRRSIGERLQELRVRAGVTSQEKLAHLAGMHRTYIGRLERGESGVTVDALAAVLAAIDLSLAGAPKTKQLPQFCLSMPQKRPIADIRATSCSLLMYRVLAVVSTCHPSTH